MAKDVHFFILLFAISYLLIHSLVKCLFMYFVHFLILLFDLFLLLKRIERNVHI